MTLGDILNPWGALRRARADLLEARGDLAKERVAVERLAQKLTDANNRADNHSLTALARANELARMEKLLKEAHFRNPKTGRLGHKGERFS